MPPPFSPNAARQPRPSWRPRENDRRKNRHLKKAGDEVNAAAQVVLAARAKVLPVRDSVRQKEKIAVEGRRKMAETRSVAEDSPEAPSAARIVRPLPDAATANCHDQPNLVPSKLSATAQNSPAELEIRLAPEAGNRQGSPTCARSRRENPGRRPGVARAASEDSGKRSNRPDGNRGRAAASARRSGPVTGRPENQGEVGETAKSRARSPGEDRCRVWTTCRATRTTKSAKAALQAMLDEKTRRENAVTAAVSGPGRRGGRGKTVQSELAVAARRAQRPRGKPVRTGPAQAAHAGADLLQYSESHRRLRSILESRGGRAQQETALNRRRGIRPDPQDYTRRSSSNAARLRS